MSLLLLSLLIFFHIISVRHKCATTFPTIRRTQLETAIFPYRNKLCILCIGKQEYCVSLWCGPWIHTHRNMYNFCIPSTYVAHSSEVRDVYRYGPKERDNTPVIQSLFLLEGHMPNTVVSVWTHFWQIKYHAPGIVRQLNITKHCGQ
jgi:hypothetical protein